MVANLAQPISLYLLVDRMASWERFRIALTRDFKIKPIIKHFRELIGNDEIAAWHRRNRKAKQPPLATQWIGISWDEMQRMKDSRDPWLSSSWPLIELRMTRLMCLDWLKARGFPQPPRSACVYCPFHRDAEWRRLKLEEPDEFAKAVQFERDMQQAKSRNDKRDSVPYLHRSCKPLDTIDFRSDTDKGQMVFEEFADECDGMCGV